MCMGALHAAIVYASHSHYLIHFVGVPHAPQNLIIIKKELSTNFSTITFLWDSGAHNEQIDYYNIEMIWLSKTIDSFNTSNTSASISEVPYNENITVTLTAHNCIGASPQNVLNFVIGKSHNNIMS